MISDSTDFDSSALVQKVRRKRRGSKIEKVTPSRIDGLLLSLVC